LDHLILLVIAVEKAMRAKRHGYHFLWSAVKLMRCAEMASKLGMLSW
jgi:hypothetical protein